MLGSCQILPILYGNELSRLILLSSRPSSDVGRFTLLSPRKYLEEPATRTDRDSSSEDFFLFSKLVTCIPRTWFRAYGYMVFIM